MAGPNTWDVMPDIPYVNGSNPLLMGADVADGRIFALLENHSTNMLTVVYYDPTVNQWFDASTQAYTAGGLVGSFGFRLVGDWFHWITKTLHYAWNYKTDTWITGLALPAAPYTDGGPTTIDSAAMHAVSDHQLVSLGGLRSVAYGGNEYVALYNRQTDTWDNSYHSIIGLGQNSHFAVKHSNGLIHYYRGGAISGPYDDHYTLNATVPSHVQVEDLPMALENIGATSDGENVWIVGGVSGSPVDTVRYRTPAGIWTTVADHPHSSGLYNTWVLRLGDYIWALNDLIDETFCRYEPAFSLPDTIEGDTPTDADDGEGFTLDDIIIPKYHGLELPHLIKPGMSDEALRQALQQNFDAIAGWSRQFQSED